MTFDASELISLDGPQALDPAVVGTKAATLARLGQAGFPVPPGVVVPATALTGTPEHELVIISERIEELVGPGPWAVRSSSLSEDQVEHSFAGQYLTSLNITADDLAAAVLRTHRSASAAHARAYAGEGEVGGIPVLIQPMVDARAAGVAFTVDPVSGAEVTTVEAVAGLGEELVSGAAEPERWRVQDGELITPTSPEVLGEGEAWEIVNLARRVESLGDGPQDIEWAIVDNEVVLLQARPVTGVTGPEMIPIEIDVPPGTWFSDRSHEPRPIKPISLFAFEEPTLPRALADFGVLIDDVRFEVIGGWTYMQIQPTGAPAPKQGGSNRTPPRWLLALAMRLHPAIRHRARMARAAIESDLAGTYLESWRQEWRDELVNDIERALDLELVSLSDIDLVAEVDHRIAVARQAALMHTRLGIAVTLCLYQLTVTCRNLMGWDDRETLELLEGLSEASTAPSRHMAGLVELARARPDLAATITSSPPDLDAIRSSHPEFAKAFDAYVRAVGHRALEYDPESPTLAETPETLLGFVAHHLAEGTDPEETQRVVAERRAAAEQRARARLEGHSQAEKAEFEQALARAQAAYPVREDNEWYTTSVQIGLMRYLVLEMSRRLADRDLLAHPDDVFFVELLDLKSALLDGRDLRPSVSENRGRWNWALAHPGPEVYGGETAEIDIPLEALPPEARLINEASLWSLSTSLGEYAAVEVDGGLAGVPASAGRYTGPARIVHGEEDFSKITPGDVVVCPATSPVWSIVYPSLGALVTDSGGVLSHPAIIAREHGIPAVVGTKTATSTFTDGEIITVDGDTGTVHSFIV